ncbi:MAG: glycosyltransferase family 39 protein [Amaricoccus sp.]|uniref:ArnT family glycosyltransferase n=1 Tax=Amaricoccus sp. TaxID=1872485 RepID=UPI00331544C2
MRPSPGPEAQARVFRLGLAGIALVTLWRVALLPFDRADLYVDEAQYWFWGQELAWGYYSKPPLIGWILRLSTAIGGDGLFWIRLPLPLIHAGTAVLVALIGRRLADARTGALAGVGFATVPGVALGSLLVSTDTPMLFCFALAMLAQIQLAARRSPGWALTLGAAVGTGMLAKYAMIYFPLAAILAALLMPRSRISWRDAGVAALVALAVLAPNLWWNLDNGFTTLRHTAENASLGAEARLSLGGMPEFWGGQFAVSGPILFAAYLAGLPRARGGGVAGYLALMSAPIFLALSAQALRAEVNANWAATAHVAAVVLGILVLRNRRGWLIASFAVNLAVTIALPLTTLFADSLRLGSGDLLLARYVGRADVSRRAAEIARREGLDTLVSGDRAILADFFYTLRDSGLVLRAEPTKGFPPHHYAQKHPLTPGGGDVLLVTRSLDGPACAPGITPREVARWTPTDGYSKREIRALRVPRACWFGS